VPEPEGIADDYRLSAYDYLLPEHLIAQQPAAQRDQSRLMVLDCADGGIRHARFADIAELFRPGDLIVVNSTKVFPARLLGRKESGGRAELLLLHFPESSGLPPGEAAALALIRSSKRPKPGGILFFADTLQARVECLLPDGKAQVTLLYPAGDDLERLLELHGEMPLPPYIRRPEGGTDKDARRYQTEYARRIGSVAAPTAGLHFSSPLLRQIEEMGVRRAEVILHVGYGTFAPVRSSDIREHRLHEEFVSVPAETAEAVNAVKAAGGRIWAVGTTTARSLEFAADAAGWVTPVEGLCGLYIYPGYHFKAVDNLITNFHLPKSSLLFLVSALAGREKIMTAYAEAVRQGCRFFSYGDAMAIVVRK
jgi:S-adenosylmethionine:tRNA ribosyltransferase-isomerase